MSKQKSEDFDERDTWTRIKFNFPKDDHRFFFHVWDDNINQPTVRQSGGKGARWFNIKRWCLEHYWWIKGVKWYA